MNTIFKRNIFILAASWIASAMLSTAVVSTSMATPLDSIFFSSGTWQAEHTALAADYSAIGSRKLDAANTGFGIRTSDGGLDQFWFDGGWNSNSTGLPGSYTDVENAGAANTAFAIRTSDGGLDKIFFIGAGVWGTEDMGLSGDYSAVTYRKDAIANTGFAIRSSDGGLDQFWFDGGWDSNSLDLPGSYSAIGYAGAANTALAVRTSDGGLDKIFFIGAGVWGIEDTGLSGEYTGIAVRKLGVGETNAAMAIRASDGGLDDIFFNNGSWGSSDTGLGTGYTDVAYRGDATAGGGANRVFGLAAVIPEPSSMAIMCIASVLMLARRKR